MITIPPPSHGVSKINSKGNLFEILSEDCTKQSYLRSIFFPQRFIHRPEKVLQIWDILALWGHCS